MTLASILLVHSTLFAKHLLPRPFRNIRNRTSQAFATARFEFAPQPSASQAVLPPRPPDHAQPSATLSANARKSNLNMCGKFPLGLVVWIKESELFVPAWHFFVPGLVSQACPRQIQSLCITASVFPAVDTKSQKNQALN